MNVIKQIVKDGQYGTQTIKMIVKSAERGAQGAQGVKGDAATVSAGKAYALDPNAEPVVMNSGTSSDAVFDFYIPKGQKGDDGAIHYEAGVGINIDENNVISATGEAAVVWGDLTGSIADQKDLYRMIANPFVFSLGHFTADQNSVSLPWTRVNPVSGDGAEHTENIPKATTETAGIISAETYNQISNNTNNIAAKLSSANLNVDSPLNKTVTGSGTDTSIKLGIADGAIAGAKLADKTVGTDKLADAAITADKIDFTTFKTSAGLPTAKTAIAAGADAVLNLYRVGGIIYANGTFASNGIGAYDQQAIESIVPAGFRPSSAVCDSDGDVYVPFVATATSNNIETTGAWTINHDGSIKISNNKGFSDITRFMYNTCWPTDDEWPS